MFFWTKPNINNCEIAGLGILKRAREAFCGLQNINLTNDTIKKQQQKTFTSTETPKQKSKNVQMASDSRGVQQQNMEIIQIISFIEETIQKLKIFGKKFKLQLDSNLTQ